MEIGHNVMHGQWDWMNHPEVNSVNWDWDTASSKEAWKHSHNYLHHSFTNIRGIDKDLGYEIMRIDPHQPWHPVYFLQPLYNLALMFLFEWGVAVHDMDIDAIRAGEKDLSEVRKDLVNIWGMATPRPVRSELAQPLMTARRAYKATVWANVVANIVRNVWSHSIIFCGHFPDQTYTFSQSEVENETRGGTYIRQLVGAANIDGGPVFHVLSGTSATRSSTTSTPTCRAAATGRSPRACARYASATDRPTTPARSRSSSTWCTARSPAWPSREARPRRQPGP